MSKQPRTTDRHPSVTESEDGDGFLGRWARRKRVARAGGDPDSQESEKPDDSEMLAKAAPSVGEEAPLADTDSQAVELTDEDMPAVDTIDENTDMSGFLSPKVSKAVKKAALKKFFHSPIFNIVDGLDDYDDDFRNFEALGDIITSDMRGQMEREAERVKESLAEKGEALEAPPSQEPPAAQADEADAVAHSADEESEPRLSAEGASDEPGDEPGDQPGDQAGVTREPGRHAASGPGKLRPKGAADSDA